MQIRAPRPLLSLPVVAAVALTGGVVPAACSPAAAPGGSSGGEFVHIDGLGSLSFPNSGSPEAQEPFQRGVLLLHSFEYEPAAEAFRRAQEIDPDFALAYWGEAMTYNHPLWRQQDRQAALAALARLAPTPQQRRALAATEREAMYLDAVETLYGEGDKQQRDLAYMEAMRKLHEAYPDDLEARAFYALSILGSRNGTRDFATYMRAAATVQPVFEANPEHPGAAHYLIHSFDDPIHAPLGLPAARAYAGIAPAAAHAQHMTTHIFVALGMWQEVIAGNVRARDTQDAQRAERGLPPNACGHYSSWLQYGYLQAARSSEAEKLLDACHERVLAGPSPGEWSYFVSMRARQILDTEEWVLAERWQVPLQELRFAGDSGRTPDAFRYRFTQAFAALRRGDPWPARELVGSAQPDGDVDRVHMTELRGLLALFEHDERTGIERLREAAAAEDAMPYEFGPPVVLKPTFELLGEELLRLGRAEEARAAFRRAVERTPGRVLAVRGLRAAG